MKPTHKALLFLHISIFIWGFTAIIGKYITYNFEAIVWHRMLIAAIVYMCFPAFWKGLFMLKFKTLLPLCGIGLIVCLHWLCFYGSIKIGNSVSVTLAALGTASLFSAFLDPLINKRSIKFSEIVLGLFVIIGVLLICYAIHLGNKQNFVKISFLAIWVGILSAALAALFTALNKKYINQVSAITLSGIEMIAGAIGLGGFLCFKNGFTIFSFTQWQITTDFIAIVLLAIVCTNLTFWLATLALNQLSAFTTNLAVNLEPIYGMLLGAYYFNEHKNLNMYFYLGALVILLSVSAKPVFNFYNTKKLNSKPHF